SRRATRAPVVATERSEPAAVFYFRSRHSRSLSGRTQPRPDCALFDPTVDRASDIGYPRTLHATLAGLARAPVAGRPEPGLNLLADPQRAPAALSRCERAAGWLPRTPGLRSRWNFRLRIERQVRSAPGAHESGLAREQERDALDYIHLERHTNRYRRSGYLPG